MRQPLRMPDGSIYSMAGKVIPIETDGLRLFMPFHYRGCLSGSTFLDASRWKNNGTISGALWTPRGMRFDGVDDYVGCGSSPVLNIKDYFTIKAWVNVSTINAGMVMSQRYETANFPYQFHIVGNPNILYL